MANTARQHFKAAARDEIKGTGDVVDSLEAALWCFWHTESYREAVLLAANLGDDADTTAAICGQVAGAHYGLGNIPKEWIETLHAATRIQGLADALLTAHHNPAFPNPMPDARRPING